AEHIVASSGEDSLEAQLFRFRADAENSQRKRHDKERTDHLLFLRASATAIQTMIAVTTAKPPLKRTTKTTNATPSCTDRPVAIFDRAAGRCPARARRMPPEARLVCS